MHPPLPSTPPIILPYLPNDLEATFSETQAVGSTHLPV